MADKLTLEVRKDNWSETRVVTETLHGEPGENEVLLKADRLALTANNISYATSGDALGYWGFFPLSTHLKIQAGKERADQFHDVFAPGHIQTRSKELGAMELMMRLGAAYVGFRQFCDNWLPVERSYGPDAVGRIYQQVLAVRTDPATGQIISMWPEPGE